MNCILLYILGFIYKKYELYQNMNCIKIWIVSKYELYQNMNCILLYILRFIYKNINNPTGCSDNPVGII
jgi:hypothetical protein